jgi:lipopolysaccharide/colanic/teichoic acid biosynthesis glycosyltransferase
LRNPWRRTVELYYQVRPGLTGLQQVSGRFNLAYEDRVRLDAYYVRNRSVWLDLAIILRTSLTVVTGRGACLVLRGLLRNRDAATLLRLGIE